MLGLGLMLIASPSDAKDKLPKITAGGITENNNSLGGVLPELLTLGGFSARAIGDPVMMPHANFPNFPNLVTAYPAKGEIGMTFTPADNSFSLRGVN